MFTAHLAVRALHLQLFDGHCTLCRDVRCLVNRTKRTAKCKKEGKGRRKVSVEAAGKKNTGTAVWCLRNEEMMAHVD